MTFVAVDSGADAAKASPGWKRQESFTQSQLGCQVHDQCGRELCNVLLIVKVAIAGSASRSVVLVCCPTVDSLVGVPYFVGINGVLVLEQIVAVELLSKSVHVYEAFWMSKNSG